MNLIKKIIIVSLLILGNNLLYSQIIDGVDFSVKCGTKFHTINIDKHYDNFQTMQCFAISKMKLFKVYYDTSGIDAVDKIDKDKNGIPDYIDSVCAIFDYVYEVQIEKMGMEKPRTNYEDEDTDNPYYVIIVLDILAYYQKPYYAITYSKGDGRSLIEIDNNYSPNKQYNGKQLYNTTGIEALKVTAAHEFQHSIQFAVGISTGYNDIFYEMGAVCMEMLVYPDLYDYVNYVNVLITNLDTFNFGYGDANNGYCFGIFFYMLTEIYGKDIIKDFFILANKINSCYKALDSILVLNNSSLNNEWMVFIEWLYHCGNNTIEGKYFSMARKFKTPAPKNTLKNYSDDTHFIYPFQLKYTRFINYSADPFIMSDTVELFVTNLDLENTIEAEKNCNGWLQILTNARSSRTEIDSSEKLFDNFWFKISSPSPYMDYFLVTKPGGKVSGIINCYPSPFNKKSNDYLCFPLADDIIIGEKVLLTIYNGTLIPVFSEMIETSIDNHNRVVKFKPDILTIGVYPFTISRGDIDLVGKIVIK